MAACICETPGSIPGISTTFALDVACSALGIAYSARDARRVKLPFALGVAYLTTKSVQKFHSLSTIQAVNANSTNFLFFFLDAVEFIPSSSPLLPVVSLHEYTGLLKKQ